VVDDEDEDGGAEGESELAEALRLSQLVYLPPEARAREEQAIYRAALINEQVSSFSVEMQSPHPLTGRHDTPRHTESGV
jgi:hypothetical protein